MTEERNLERKNGGRKQRKKVGLWIGGRTM